jgi:4'-phosphopantetheinyl transferase EntD
MPATRADDCLVEMAEAAGLAGLLPSGVVLVALIGPGERLPLPSGEATAAEGLPRGRAGEFIAGRWCAHRALERLGCPEVAIGSGLHGEPCWPQGFTGSITHKPGTAVAVAAREAIGVDLEPAAALPMAVRHKVMLPAEPDLPPGFPVSTAVAERIVFSAKEAYYKWHSSAHPGDRRPGFADVRVRLRADGRPNAGNCPRTPGESGTRGWPRAGWLPASGRLLAEPASGMPPAVGAWVCGPRWILAAVWAATGPGWLR